MLNLKLFCLRIAFILYFCQVLQKCNADIVENEALALFLGLKTTTFQNDNPKND